VRSNNNPVTVHILDKEYRILCQDGEQDDLLASARYLDMKMREIRATGKVIGSDRIAVMAALNIALLASARYLDMKMREIRATGKVIGSDRIAVMAALNIAHELLKHQQSKDENTQSLSQRIHSLQKKVEIALNSGNQLEL
jgi:cell division protein ZapA